MVKGIQFKMINIPVGHVTDIMCYMSKIIEKLANYFSLLVMMILTYFSTFATVARLLEQINYVL